MTSLNPELPLLLSEIMTPSREGPRVRPLLQQPQPGTKGPTRRQPAKYATQGGLSDDYIAEIGVNVQHLHDVAIKAVDDVNKFTHVRPGSVIDNREIAAFVGGAMHALWPIRSIGVAQPLGRKWSRKRGTDDSAHVRPLGAWFSDNG